MRMREHPHPRPGPWCPTLLLLTLATSALHFADNAFHRNLYPGPPSLTRNIILGAWLLLPLTAWLAYRLGTRLALIAYSLLGFTGFAHYLMPHTTAMPLRCSATITAEAAAAALLIAHTLAPARLSR